MKKHLDKKTVCLALAALMLAGSIAVQEAAAYFTTYATASGGAEISLGFSETIPGERVVDMTKHISIENTGVYPCFVRVKVLAGTQHAGGLEIIAGNGWTLGEEGYYYYESPILAGASTTEELLAKIEAGDSTDDFNVIVIQESTPALYDENGEPYADWNLVLDSSQTSYN